MARKTYYLEKYGIRVEGCRNQTEARKQWEAARDEFVDRATACPPWVFAFRGHVAVVTALPHADSWEYTIVRPNDSGRKTGQCFYSAPSQIAAIAEALGALAQQVWSRDIANDGEFFDSMVTLARLSSYEAKSQRDNFTHVTAYWRNHPIAA